MPDTHELASSHAVVSEREQARKAAFSAWWGRNHESRLLVDLWDMGADWQAEQDATIRAALRALVESLRDGLTGDDQYDWCVAGCGRKPDEVWNSDWQHKPECPFAQARAALGESV